MDRFIKIKSRTEIKTEQRAEQIKTTEQAQQQLTHAINNRTAQQKVVNSDCHIIAVVQPWEVFTQNRVYLAAPLLVDFFYFLFYLDILIFTRRRLLSFDRYLFIYTLSIYLSKEKRMSAWKCLKLLTTRKFHSVMKFSNGTIIYTKETEQRKSGEYTYIQLPIPNYKEITKVHKSSCN